MGFAYMMSDAAFGSLPAREIYPKSGNPITIDMLRVGDILRLPGHSVVVLEKNGDHIIITEGNYQRRVHWGRKISAEQVKKARYYTTRYPEGYTEPEKPQVKTVEVTVNGKTYRIADISGHWAQEHIKVCISSSLLSASGDASCAYFRPNESATRAQVVCALYRAKGSPEVEVDNAFSDVTEDWYRSAVSWAVKSGLVSGVSKDKFSPDSPITREQLALILSRYAGADDPETDLSAYADAKNISDFAKPGVCWAVKNGIISGKEGLLLPGGATTRAEFAAMIVRLYSLLAKA